MIIEDNRTIRGELCVFFEKNEFTPVETGDFTTVEQVVAAVRKQYDKAEQLLKDNMPKLHELAKYLYEKETITGDEFMEILNLSPDQLTTTRIETN